MNTITMKDICVFADVEPNNEPVWVSLPDGRLVEIKSVDAGENGIELSIEL